MIHRFRTYGVRSTLVEVLVTDTLRRYMNLRLGNGPVTDGFTWADAEVLCVRMPRTVALFDRAQEIVFA